MSDNEKVTVQLTVTEMQILFFALGTAHGTGGLEGTQTIALFEKLKDAYPERLK